MLRTQPRLFGACSSDVFRCAAALLSAGLAPALGAGGAAVPAAPGGLAAESADSTAADSAAPDVRPVIAIDCDEVLAVTNETFIKWLNESHGTNFNARDITSYEYDKCLGQSAEWWAERFAEFDAAGGQMALPRVPGAYEALVELSKDFDFVVVTSRGGYAEAVTRKWLQLQFHGLLDKLRLTKHWELDGCRREVKLQKSDVCVEEGAVALIDDYYKYCLEAADRVPLVLHFSLNDAYAWAPRPPQQPPNVVRVTSWAEIALKLREAKPRLIAAYRKWRNSRANK